MRRKKRAWDKVATVALGFLYPPRCVMCATGMSGGGVCDRCRQYLPLNDNCCERCALPLAATSDYICSNCLRNPPPFVSARAPFIYDYPIDSAIKALKFNRKLYFADALGEFLLPEFESLGDCFDALVPVPLHRWRQTRRGFNQAVELCRPLRRETGLRIESRVRRVKATRAQTGLSADNRRRNLRNAFTVVSKLRCRRPLIVDDVMTTGETCRQLAAALLSAGAKEVSVLALARSVPDQPTAVVAGAKV